jgi:hypothetical protein
MFNLFKGKNEMKISETLDYWGLSEHNIQIRNFIKVNNFDKSKIFIGDKEYYNSKYTVSLLFKPVNLFKYDYYTPEEIFTDSIEESFFIGFTIGDFYGKPKFPFELPFGLTFNDSYEEVKKKLNVSSSKITKLEDSVYYQFNFDKFYALTYFSLDDKLIYLVVKLFQKSELSNIELQKSFKLQNKNLKTENLTLLDELKIQKPTFQWKQRMFEGDDIFNDENILETSKQLDVFIDNLKDAVLKRNSKNIYNATKKNVKSINKLNERFDYFIETTEREELCEFIDKCIRGTGFELENGFDITQEWREW